MSFILSKVELMVVFFYFFKVVLLFLSDRLVDYTFLDMVEISYKLYYIFVELNFLNCFLLGFIVIINMIPKL